MTAYQLLIGDCIARLRELPANSVHCVATSPPYYGLRDYKLPSSIWGGKPKCQHAWSACCWRDVNSTRTVRPGDPQERNVGSQQAVSDERRSDTCFHCGAWRGALGLEPSVDLYLQHIVLVFREVRRVLHPAGTIWVNMGDSYCSDAGHSDPGVDRPEHELRLFRVGPDRDPKRGAAAEGQPLQAIRHGNGIKPKDLLMMPARVALALQEDGWYLRSQIPWVKSSAMPESVEDRPTSALEYVFLLSKSDGYFYDKEAGRIDSSGTAHARGNGVNPKAMGPNSRMRSDKDPYHQLPSRIKAKQNRSFSAAVKGLVTTRARRNTDWLTESLLFDSAGDPLVFQVNPQPFSLEMCDACRTIYAQKEYRTLAKDEKDRRICKCGVVSWVSHFATFPEALVSPCVRLGTSEHGACSHCGAPYERIVEKQFVGDWHPNGSRGKARTEPQKTDGMPRYDRAGTAKWAKEAPQSSGARAVVNLKAARDAGNDHEVPFPAPATLGWRPTCDHPLYPHEVVPCVALDPFAGTGRTGMAAMKLGRQFIGIELNPNYAAMAELQLRKTLDTLRCEKEQAEIQARKDVVEGRCPAILATMGMEDWEKEKALIAEEGA